MLIVLFMLFKNNAAFKNFGVLFKEACMKRWFAVKVAWR
jgi:hypothetical protein